MNKYIQSISWVVLLLVLWELASRFGLVNVYLLPPFTQVAETLVRELFTGRLGIQTCSSVLIILEGFGISFLLAVAITALCSSFRVAENLFDTLSTIMNPLPAVAVMPLIIMWFGISTGAMLAIIVHGVLWALTRHMLDGLRSVPPIYREWGCNIGLSPWRMFADILILAIMPDFLTGIRVGWGRAWRALISAEMVFGIIGAAGGLGHYIYLGRVYARTADVLAGIIVVALIGVVFESFVFGTIERATIRKWGMIHE